MVMLLPQLKIQIALVSFSRPLKHPNHPRLPAFFWVLMLFFKAPEV
jgi:hypothetical protein